MLAAFELENANSFEKVAYALWKVTSVQAGLAGLFCFRRDPDGIGGFVARLGEEVMQHVPNPAGELLVVAGTRAAAETFPDGYFRPFRWQPDARRFARC